LKTLLLGWGNPDRQDDGAAWHVLAEVARRSALSLPDELGEAFEPTGGDLELFFSLQLAPEMAETIAAYDRVVFIDAHTGAVPESLNIRRLSPWFQTSPLTHHLTAESCLELADKLYGSRPEAWLMSVRGYAFGFARELSPATADLVSAGADALMSWLAGKPFPEQD
jgi:hydrogenase maturation protease